VLVPHRTRRAVLESLLIWPTATTTGTHGRARGAFFGARAFGCLVLGRRHEVGRLSCGAAVGFSSLNGSSGGVYPASPIRAVIS